MFSQLISKDHHCITKITLCTRESPHVPDLSIDPYLFQTSSMSMYWTSINPTVPRTIWDLSHLLVSKGRWEVNHTTSGAFFFFCLSIFTTCPGTMPMFYPSPPKGWQDLPFSFITSTSPQYLHSLSVNPASELFPPASPNTRFCSPYHIFLYIPQPIVLF